MKSPNGHADLSASGANRWMHCGASIELGRGLPDTETEYSREGTSAHGVLNLSLTEVAHPDRFIGTIVHGVEVDGEMTAAVEHCAKLVWEIKLEAPDVVFWLEERISLAAVLPPRPMFGTADIIGFSRARRKLWIVDYKHGQGVVVSVKDNPQTRYYGVGALLKLEEELGPGLVDTIELIIVQPRASHPDGIVRREILSYADLAIDFLDELLAAADKAIFDPGPPVVGPWCRFCKAQPICPAQQALAAQTAQLDFADSVSFPPTPEMLSLEELTAIHDRAPIIHAWLKRIAEHLQRELEQGRPVPGYKLVKKQARRKWRDENQAAFALEASGLPKAKWLKTEIMTPPSLEKIIGKVQLAIFEPLIVKESSGLTIAPLDDERPAESAGATYDFNDFPFTEKSDD